MDKIRLGFSTCPNDTFMFDALVNGRLDTGGLEIDVIMADIEQLNLMILEGELDMSKISFAAYPAVSDKFLILNAGSAVGYQNGPLIISRRKIFPDEICDVHMAIPGIHTTANYLLEILFPPVKEKSEYLFSDIEEAILSNEVDAGLIIHETRFTYQKKGLRKVADLGENWEERFKVPVPLGGIIIKRELKPDIIHLADRLMRASVEFAMANPTASEKFVKKHAQDLTGEVIRKHIDLYVNDFSVQLGDKGRKAITFLFEKGKEKGLFDYKNNAFFV